jgi:hypothetical protein
VSPLAGRLLWRRHERLPMTKNPLRVRKDAADLLPITILALAIGCAIAVLLRTVL